MSGAPPLSAADFRERTGVSAATLARLEIMAALLVKWQARINLVGGATLADVWRRHFLDSAQLLPLLPAAGPVVDLGSGAGFPGLVLAILGVPDVHLIESDGRKCAFLQEAARATGTAVTLHRARAEAVPPMAAGAVTARALAPLGQLLDLAEKFIAPHTICVFPKGRNAEGELTESQKTWMMTATRIDSVTDSDATILKLEGLSRRHDR